MIYISFLDKNYQFSCDVILYLTDKEEVNHNGEMQAEKSRMDEKVGIFCCLLTSRDPDENWQKTSEGNFDKKLSKNHRGGGDNKDIGHVPDLVTTIAFTQ